MNPSKLFQVDDEVSQSRPPLERAPVPPPGPRLSRVLSFRAVVSLVVSSITPATGVVVILPATILALQWGAPVALLAAGILCLPLAYCYSTLGRAFPSAGAEYMFAARFLGLGVAHATLLTMVAGVTVALAAILQGATALLSGLLDIAAPVWLLPLLATIPVVVSPQRVLRITRITSVILWVEIMALAAIAAFGVWLFVGGETTVGTCTSMVANSLTGLDARDVLAHTAIAYFAIAGFGTAIVLSEEDRDGGRSSARAVGWALFLALSLELVAVVAILLGLGCGPGWTPSGAGAVLSDFAALQGSPPLRTILLGGAFLAALNAAIVITMQIGRVVYSAAREDFIPAGGSATLRRVNPDTNTPVAATLVVISLAVIVGMLMPAETLIMWASATLLVPPAVVAASHLTWRYRASGTGVDLLVPVAALAGLAVVGVFALGSQPSAFILASITWTCGLALARLSLRRQRP